MAEIIAQVEAWAAGGEIVGLTPATESTIRLNLAGIEPHQVSAFIDLTLSRVERAVIVDAAQEADSEVLFGYFGPLDNVTRDTCTAVLTDPQNETGYTTDEIASLPVGLTEGGGYNCRHTWRPMF